MKRYVSQWTGHSNHHRRLSGYSRRTGRMVSSLLLVPNIHHSQSKLRPPASILTSIRARLLLKYTSRDEVDVLARGSGGVADLRDAISAYTEPSPLYGFLRFRRRSVLLKYIPEGTSRLLQGKTRLLSIQCRAQNSHGPNLASQPALRFTSRPLPTNSRLMTPSSPLLLPKTSRKMHCLLRARCMLRLTQPRPLPAPPSALVLARS